MHWNGAPGEIRTPDPLLRRQMLYPAELRARRITLPNSALETLVFEVDIPIAARNMNVKHAAPYVPTLCFEGSPRRTLSS
jgi:hypothetical protein